MPNKTQDQLVAEMHTDIKWIKDFIGCVDDKYAKKWVQTAVTGVISTILVAVIGALLGLILIPRVMAMTNLYINLIT